MKENAVYQNLTIEELIKLIVLVISIQISFHSKLNASLKILLRAYTLIIKRRTRSLNMDVNNLK